MDEYKNLEDLNLIPNAEDFECPVCFLDYEPGEGVMLHECLHIFCRWVAHTQYTVFPLNKGLFL